MQHIRLSTSCNNCAFNSRGLTSVKCIKNPLAPLTFGTYASEYVCDEHMKRFCCDTLRAFSDEICESDYIIERKDGRFSLLVNKLAAGSIAIGYCPWCGEKLSNETLDELSSPL